MSGFRISASILGFAAALVFASPASAAGECKDLKQFIKDETAGAQKYVDIFTFRKNHRGDNVLLLFKDTTERASPPKHWLFLNRPQTETSDFCVVGRGEEFGQHDDMHENTYSNTFGEPGSGYPRCAASAANAPASDLLRAWAYKQLNDAIALYTASPKTSGFQFLIASDQDWIIIEDHNNDNPQTSCFYDRGSDVFMRFNNTVPAP